MKGLDFNFSDSSEECLELCSSCNEKSRPQFLHAYVENGKTFFIHHLCAWLDGHEFHLIRNNSIFVDNSKIAEINPFQVQITIDPFYKQANDAQR